MKKILGWSLLLLSAMSMTMCSMAGPDTQAFVMSPAGMWAWLVWLALLIGGSWLVYGSAKELESPPTSAALGQPGEVEAAAGRGAPKRGEEGGIRTAATNSATDREGDMFRRFMIVCWSLFGISIATLLLGLAMYQANRRDAIELAEARQIQTVDIDEIYQTLVNSERYYRGYISTWTGFEAKGIPTDAASLRDAAQELAAAERDLAAVKEHRHDAYVGVSIMGIGIAASIGVLLWNLLCLVANWIWRARSAVAPAGPR